MKTLGSTRNQLLDEVGRTGQFTAQAHTYINSAIEHYRDDPFKFNEQIATANTQLAEYMDLPGDWGEEYTITFNEGDGEYYPLTYRTMEEMDERFTTKPGTPMDYTIFRQQLRLSPIPDRNTYSIKMAYRARPETATSSEQTNIFLQHANELIVSRAGSLMAKRILKDDAVANRLAADEAKALLKLRAITSRYQSTGRTKRRK